GQTWGGRGSRGPRVRPIVFLLANPAARPSNGEHATPPATAISRRHLPPDGPRQRPTGHRPRYDDRRRLQDYLGRAVIRCSWRVYAFVIMSNHLHVVLKTPEPNLARGMQTLLSSYANAWARRHRFSGHVFQGRYRTELVEDETYLWTVTRYVHLNPVRAGVAEHPADWEWSSYPGYAHRTRRLEWLAYDELLASWTGAFGGSDPAGAYRRYVTAGLSDPPDSPWKDAYHGWVLGSGAFIERVKAMVRGQPARERRRESRLML